MAVVQTSIREFFKELKEVEDKTLRGLMRFQLELGMKIQRQTQENIKNTFGKGKGGPKSDITERAYGASARRSGRSGALLRSVLLEKKGESVQVSVGGPGVPYAAIHEQGGTILPKRVQFLTIPFSPKVAGTRAGEHDLYYDVDPDWGPVLRFNVGWRTAKGENTIAYLLRRRARIPARPYFKPAVDKVSTDETTRELMVKLIGKQASLEVK